MSKLKVFDGLKSEWGGLWYHPESRIYTSQVFSLANLRQFKGSIQILLAKNKFYKKGTNRPEFQFCITNSDYTKAQDIELVEDEPYIKLSDAVEIARNILSDYEYGYSMDDLVVEVESFMKEKSIML